MSIRVKPKQYAQLLYEVTKGKTADQLPSILSEFVLTLRKKHHTKYTHQIISFFKKIYNAEHNILEVYVESAEVLDDENSKSIQTYIEKNYPGQEIIFTKKVSPQLRGGVMIRVGDKMIDGSVLKNIIKFRQTMRIR
jgi:F-type H+-transporting ATPase subunit delta